jgi:transposase
MLIVLLAFWWAGHDLGVGQNFLCGDRAQLFLMPPDMREWLPDGHLALFVVDVVEGLDLSRFVARYRSDGRGGAAYDPAVMVGLLVYGYCVGERSSRRIERRCVEDVAFRVVAGNLRPDHATIARFRVDHEAALAALFVQVLALCAEAGLVRVGLVALDGTKMAAAAALSSNMSDAQLQAAIAKQVAKMFAEAAEVDAAEDELYGDARGDELPAELADRDSRLRRLAEARERLAERQRAERERGADRPEPTANVVDPESRIMKTQRGWVQGYNAQAAATADQVIVAASVCDQPADVEQFAPMVAATASNLAAVGVEDPVGTWLADAGYYSSDNAELDVPGEVLIATAKADKLPTQPPAPIDDRPDPSDVIEEQRIDLLDGLFAAVDAGDIDMSDARERSGLSQAQTYKLRAVRREQGRDGLVRQNRRGNPRATKTPRSVRVKHAMQTRLADPALRALYKQRGQIIEPIFGQIKDPRRIREFQRRGLPAVDAEWKLICATHNLLKLWRA